MSIVKPHSIGGLIGSVPRTVSGVFGLTKLSEINYPFAIGGDTYTYIQDGKYWRCHMFSQVGSDTLTFLRGGLVEYLVVGGGGGGGTNAAGGGGAGGFRTGTGLFVTAGIDHAVSVGAGGNGGAAGGSNNGSVGGDSAFGTITSAGGGYGGTYANAGGAGGSGGGGGSNNSPGTGGTGGAGNTPTTSPSQGTNGGNGNTATPPGAANNAGGGGGGASAAGASSTASTNASGGAGGAGTASSISGSPVTYAGGGGGGGAVSPAASGGAGGGGQGGVGQSGNDNATAGAANTGGGGGGGCSFNGLGKAGGSGIVIVRYQITQAEFEGDEPYYDNVSLLLHMNGANGSTTFTDSSKHRHAVTANGNAQISTAQSKFGGASAAFDGTGDYLTVPNNAAFNFGTGSFTVEAWVYLNSYTLNAPIVDFGNGNSLTRLALNQGDSSGAFAFYQGNVGSIIASSISVPLSTWSHVAIVRNGTSCALYINGVSGGAATNTGSYTDANCFIGKSNDASFFHDGYIDDLRITKGVARYTANFTPPQREFLP